MPKIKNWKKITDNKKSMEWINEHPTKKQSYPDNDKPVIRGRTIVTKRSSGKWAAIYGTPATEKHFDTRDEARKFAVKFMRNHPNGTGAYAE